MQIHIFTEGAETTTEDANTELRNYYSGLFRQARKLEDDLSKYGDVELHIVSKEFGTASGEEQTENVIDKRVEKPMDAIRNDLRSAADGDVVVILLSTDVFEDTVSTIWPELIEEAESKSIWCLGASSSALNSVPLEQLEDKGCSLITYQRVGVARLGTETRETLYEMVKRTAENIA